MQPSDRYRALDVYFGGYLHEDWDIEFSNPIEALVALIVQLPEAELRSMLVEFEHLLSLPDPSLHETLDRLSVHFDPAVGSGWDEREWVTTLRDRVRAELEDRQSSS